MVRRLGLVLTLAAAACGGHYRPATPAPAADAGEGARGVAAVGLPFAILDGRTGREVTADAFWDRLRAARAVCAGEQHPSPHDHWVQLQILDHLSTPPPGGTAPLGLGLGLEMVQQPFQGVLDDWSQARIAEPALLTRTGWGKRWGFDFALYRPVLELARARGVALVALNAPSELVKRVARVGLAGLVAGERARLPDLELGDIQHRAWFDRVMSDMGDEAHGGDPHGHGAPEPSVPAPPPADHPAVPAMPKADDIYAAQVVWDESMADRAARWLDDGGQRLVILAGNGHCHDSAIVRRLQRRGVASVLSVRPIIDDGDGNVAAAVAEAINDYVFVMTPPAPSTPPPTPRPWM